MGNLDDKSAAVIVSALLSSYKLLKQIHKRGLDNVTIEIREVEEALVILGYDPDKIN